MSLKSNALLVLSAAIFFSGVAVELRQEQAEAAVTAKVRAEMTVLGTAQAPTSVTAASEAPTAAYARAVVRRKHYCVINNCDSNLIAYVPPRYSAESTGFFGGRITHTMAP